MHHLSLMFSEWGASFSLSDCCWGGLCSWSPHMWAVLTAKGSWPPGSEGAAEPRLSSDLQASFTANFASPAGAIQAPVFCQQISGAFFVLSRLILLVVPQQCFNHGNLRAASALLLSCAVASSPAQGFLGRRVQQGVS